MMPHQHLPAARTESRHDLVSIDGSGSNDRVVVVVFLRGGADALTLVPPVGDDRYHVARPMLGVSMKDALPLDGYFGMHPALRPMMKLWETGQLGIMHGTGTEDDSRSHFQAQDVMEHGGAGRGSGWLARYLRAATKSPAAMASVSIGTTRAESLRGAPAGAVMQSIADFDIDAEPELLARLHGLYATLQSPLGAAARDTVDAVRRLRVLRTQPTANANALGYPDTMFGRGLHELARLIRTDVGLIASTIDLDGWDTHFVQSQLIGGLMQQLASGLDAFIAELGEHAARTSIVVMSEFGRRLRENSSFGTDHGAGGVMFLAGGSVRQTDLHGLHSSWADLGESNLDDVGDVPAAVHFSGVLRPVLEWATPGVDLSTVFTEGANVGVLRRRI